MNNEKNIVIKHLVLKRLRNNLRLVIILSVSKLSRVLLKKKNGTSSLEEFQAINTEQQNLDFELRKSICQCGACYKHDRDMVYEARFDMWFCLECHHNYQEHRNPEKWFNRGVVVRDDLIKPCAMLKWCPYGKLVEAFLIDGNTDKTVCYTFNHDCPVFYVGSKNTEKFPNAEPSNSLLEDNLINIPWYNQTRPKYRRTILKPCKVIGFCPYGSFGDKPQRREIKRQIACSIYSHDCPAFYHAEKITDDFYFYNVEEQKILDPPSFDSLFKRGLSKK